MRSAYKIKWYQKYHIVLFYLYYIFIIYGLYEGFYKDNKIFFIVKIILLFLYIILLGFTFYFHIKCFLADNSVTQKDLDSKMKYTTKDYCDYCNICEIIKPERAHHCKVCGLCIKKMDHHCFWIGNCVGEKNTRDFVYFLIGNTICFFLNFAYLVKSMLIQINNPNSKRLNNAKISAIKIILILLKENISIITCLLSFAAFVYTLFCFIAFLLNCIKYNMTQIELKKYSQDITKCPYFNDNIKENFLKIVKPFPFSFNLTDDKLIEENILNTEGYSKIETKEDINETEEKEIINSKEEPLLNSK